MKQFSIPVQAVGENLVAVLYTPANNKHVIFITLFLSVTFEDQYLQIGTQLPSNPNIYGLGEHVCPLRLTSGQTYTMWNFDTATPVNLNLYGSHPFYLDLRSSGLAHGVFLRNSNGMDVSLNDQSLSYKVIGGILDFYFFLGPQPEAVIEQYQEVIGHPALPPYWALGFHQSRYGYPNVETLEAVVGNYSSNKLPLDTMWTDIDYMDQYKDFTLDPNNFAEDKMQQFVANLHSDGQHYVVITDPGIKNENGYKPYDDGVNAGVFIRDKNNNFFVGKVWPGNTVFPDFFHPAANQYWQDQIASFLQMVPVDGLWIDMNEISNFCNGECTNDDDDDDDDDFNAFNDKRDSFQMKQMTVGFDPNNPPYAINNQGNHIALNTKTLDMDAQHYGGVLEYNSHNLFGITEDIATSTALRNLTKKRSFILSRSTFPGSGMYAAKWTGDNHANFDDLYYSIPGMLNFQMFGIPLVGSDVCGFLGDTNEELCTRWMELGAFYPFSRNHNGKGARSQEPYTFSQQMTDTSRWILNVRYSLLPYYYTLFYFASCPASSTEQPASTVTRPLFFEFPDDQNTYAIDKQFMVGGGLLVSPVLTQGATSVTAYFPKARWYDFFTRDLVSASGGEPMTLDTPLGNIQVHVRGGVIIPMQEPSLTTMASRLNPYLLLVALDSDSTAYGLLYLDDGISINASSYSLITYNTSGSSTGHTTLKSSVKGTYASVSSQPPLNTTIILGVGVSPAVVTVNSKPLDGDQVLYNSTTSSLILSRLGLPMNSNFTVTWN